MKTIGIVTGSRADYGIYRPVMEALRSDRELQVEITVTGMHLSPRFGTLEEIVADGFDISERVSIPLANDRPRDIGRAIGEGVSGFADLFNRWRPDVLLLQGDRFEVFSAAVASLPFGIPIAHMHGGELTLGAIDDPLRHSITKMAHLHFVSTDMYARRVAQLGEEDWRISVTGAPGLDNLNGLELIPDETLAKELGYPARKSPLLVTLHPETRERQATRDLISATIAALETYTDPIVFTAPNADTYGNEILRAVKTFCDTHDNAVLFPNLGTLRYFSLMSVSCAMLGNSSSGIVEAASFELPVLNLGARQQGRLAGENVVHVAPREAEIRSTLNRVLDSGFRLGLRNMENPYGDGHAADRVVAVLRKTPIDQRLINKGFIDR